MASTAQSNRLSPRIGVICCVAICWTVVYDTCYAMVNSEEDLKIGVKSITILSGEQDKIMIGLLQALTLAALFIDGWYFELYTFYFWLLSPVLLIFIYQQWSIRDRSREGCFAAFMNNRWLGSLVLLAIWLGQIFTMRTEAAVRENSILFICLHYPLQRA